MAKADSQAPQPSATSGLQKRARATVSSRYLIPLATAMLLGACFVVYYLTFVQQNREYLLTRNYRVLATLGEQMSDTLANQTATLKSYVNAFENAEFHETETPTKTHDRTNGRDILINLAASFAADSQRNAFRMSDEIHSYAPRLNHVKIQKADPKLVPNLVRRDGEWMFQLAALDPRRDHEATGLISMQALSQSFSQSIVETFDDVLIANEDGAIVFQNQRNGPHFPSLSDLVKSASSTDKKKDSKDTNDVSHGASEQFVEVDLAGVPYIVFLEPVTIDLNPTHNADEQQTKRFTLSGLVPLRRFRWQSLAISYPALIYISSAFLLLCLSAPIMKIFFLNEREALRLREIVLLPLLFVAIAGALTSICLQTIYFNMRHDDTDLELQNISGRMQDNIKSELAAMREQLVAACHEPDFEADVSLPSHVVRRNVLTSEFQHSGTPYPYFDSIFWTDDKGRQIIKWSSTDYATPLIDISGLEFSQSLQSRRHYFFLDEQKPFRLDSLLPPNQDNYVAVLGMRMSDCAASPPAKAKFAFLAAQPLSLIGPYLPLGISFALVDETGRVLFHSDKYRNNRENILIETGNDRELLASIYGHSNELNFSLDYRGREVRARVVSVPGVTQSPWSLIVYKDVLYAQTYDLEIVTMAGTLLFVYLAIPSFIVCCLYFLVKPKYAPEWLWPSPSSGRIYRFQIEAGIVMVVLSAALSFLSRIEESLYAAAAAGYVTLIIVFWSVLSRSPSSRSRAVFKGICCAAAAMIVAFPIWQAAKHSSPKQDVEQWPWCVLIGLMLFPFAWAVHRRGHLAPGRWRFPQLSYRRLYYIRAIVLLTVVGILPPLSFFRNSMLLEDYLHIRAAQLHAAMSWNSRERMIEKHEKEVPGISGMLIRPDAKEGPVNLCSTVWDFYLGSYFGTQVHRERHPNPPPTPSDYLDPSFLRFAHFLHHSYNNIGAEALGVLRNPVLSENVYLSQSPPGSPASDKVPGGRSDEAQGVLPEWQWEWKQGDAHHLQLRLHEGADTLNTCASPDKRDLVVASIPPVNRVSGISNVLTWLGVTTVMGLLFWHVTRKIFLFDLGEPASRSAKEVRESLKGAGNALVLPSSRYDWSLELAGAGASQIDIRKLATEPDWGAKLDETKLGKSGPIVMENFDWELGYPEANQQRLLLTDRLIANLHRVIAVSAVDPSPFLIGHCGLESEGDAGRWAAVLGSFTRINLGHQSSWARGAQIKKEAPAIWDECSVQPELYRIGEDLRDAGNQVSETEQIVAEVGEKAAQYYYLEWRACTQEECFLLAGLARDGMVNPRNTVSLRQLLRRRLIVRDPQFRIMNESFRRFVLAQAGITMQEEWEAEAAGSGWGKARGPFATVLVLVGLFLLGTQQQFLQTSAGLLTAAAGCVAALLKLIGVVHGRSSDS